MTLTTSLIELLSRGSRWDAYTQVNGVEFREALSVTLTSDLVADFLVCIPRFHHKWLNLYILFVKNLHSLTNICR